MPRTFVFAWLAVAFVVLLAYALHFILEKPFTSTAKRVPLSNHPEVMPAMVK
jgi:hypothetical protein